MDPCLAHRKRLRERSLACGFGRTEVEGCQGPISDLCSLFQASVLQYQHLYGSQIPMKQSCISHAQEVHYQIAKQAKDDTYSLDHLPAMLFDVYLKLAQAQRSRFLSLPFVIAIPKTCRSLPEQEERSCPLYALFLTLFLTQIDAVRIQLLIFICWFNEITSLLVTVKSEAKRSSWTLVSADQSCHLAHLHVAYHERINRCSLAFRLATALSTKTRAIFNRWAPKPSLKRQEVWYSQAELS